MEKFGNLDPVVSRLLKIPLEKVIRVKHWEMIK